VKLERPPQAHLTDAPGEEIPSIVARGARTTTPHITLSGKGWFAVIGNLRTPTTCVIYVGTTPTPPERREHEPVSAASAVPARIPRSTPPIGEAST